jgi:hypothetical protein
MTKDEMDFLNHLFGVLGYDTSDDAPPIYQQFYDRYKEVLKEFENGENVEQVKKVRKLTTFDMLSVEEKRKRWREYNRVRNEKLWAQRKKRK